MWMYMRMWQTASIVSLIILTEPQDTVVYRGDGSSFELHLDANEIKWYEI